MPKSPVTPPVAEEREPCADCGDSLAPLEAVVYHGLIYHPACATGVPPAPAAPGWPRPSLDRWPFGAIEFNCTGDL